MSIVPRVVRAATLDWVKFDAELARDGSVDPVDKALYAALATFVDADYRDSDPDPNGVDVPTRAVLARCIGRSVDTVDRSIKRLEARGLLRVERRRDPDNPRRWIPSVYELLDHERWDERAAERARARAEARARGSRMDAARGSRTGAAVKEEKEEKREETSSSSPPTGAHESHQHPQEEEEEVNPRNDQPVSATPNPADPTDLTDSEPEHTVEAAALVAELPSIAAAAGQPIGRGLRVDETDRLAALVVAALARGWTVDRLRPVLADDLRTAQSPVATWHHRLANLGDPLPADETAAAPASPPKCDQCNPFRYLEDNEGLPLGPCPTCHPSLVGRSA